MPQPASQPQIDWPAALAEHNRWLRTVVQARVREPQAIDEIMQEVALAAVKQSSPLADPAKVAPWLYRLAVRQSLLYRRRWGRFRKLTARYADQLPEQVQDDPLSWLIADERRTLVQRALRELAPRDAEILLLKYTENWSYHQIAEHLGIGHAAVETRLHRARQRLRSSLTALNVLELRPSMAS